MKAKVNSQGGVYLIYQLSRDEHSSFLNQCKKYSVSGLKFEFYDGGEQEDSWIKAERWIM